MKREELEALDLGQLRKLRDKVTAVLKSKNESTREARAELKAKLKELSTPKTVKKSADTDAAPAKKKKKKRSE